MAITINEVPAPTFTFHHPTLSDFVGQSDAITCLKTYCAAALQQHKVLDHVLLTGASGLGKTLLANAIAGEMGSNMRITSGAALSFQDDLIAILTNLNEGDILFIDDIHRLKPDFEEILYPALQDYAIDIVLGKGRSASSIHLDLPYFTMIGASHKTDCLSDALKSRFGIRIELHDYSSEELAQIIEHQATNEQLRIDPESALLIGEIAAGNPREALTILKRVRDFALVYQENTINKSFTTKVLNLLGKTGKQ